MKVFITGEVPGDGDSFGLDSTLCLVNLERRGEKEECCCYKRDEPETGLVEGIGESRSPRPSLDDIPEALRCVVCLGAEREVFNTVFLCCKKHGIYAIPCFLQLSDSRGGSARLWTCVHMR